MTYTELLTKPEWFQKCNKILNKDKFTCQVCGSVGYHNNHSFMSFDNIEDIDFKLGDILFPNFSFHELFKFMTDNLCKNHNRGRFDIGNPFFINNRYIYKPFADIEEIKDTYKGEKTYPFGICLISENILGNVLYFIYKIIYPSCYMFFVNQQLTQKWYVMIKRDDSNKETIIIQWNQYIIYLQRPIQMNGLNIHHKYYIHRLKPWEYDDDALITLCEKCHKNTHENVKVPIYSNKKELIGYTTICPKCGGSGYLPQYNHIESGICFKCGGEGVILLDKYVQ